MDPIKLILTGATGMVGEGVLIECLQSADVEKILVVGRKSCGVIHPKLSEIIISDFFKLDDIASQLIGYNACFFCLGVSSVGMKKDLYEKLTYDLTMNFAKLLAKQNSDMQFCYISGASTDSTEKGKLHWARVKGKTENDLQKLGFKKTWLFRPGGLRATKGQKNILPAYKYFAWLLPAVERLFPNSVSSLAQLGQAMIRVVMHGYRTAILEVKDIKKVVSY